MRWQVIALCILFQSCATPKKQDPKHHFARHVAKPSSTPLPQTKEILSKSLKEPVFKELDDKDP